ncbi:ParB/RepB/Spo0J family partition protein [Tissierella praeacuta]|uniref:ParB/RepB/Spo0J family partition protein n=1 Tax=Tissierella praeacuta TaxID=43131 RepID=UPI0028B1D98B|nr:ParB N-terminal domain-containing protein [Tissierella praeacuta]
MEKPKTFNVFTNDLFKSDKGKEDIDNKKGTTEVDLSQLVPFKNHPFKLYEGERLNDMVESIKEHGVITPLIVRQLEDDKYEILSGHNRANAAKRIGLETVPVVIKEDLTDEEAMLIVTETNLIQRSFSELSHSEKARILTERHNAIKEQGRRTDLINEIERMSNTDDLQENSDLGQFVQKLESRDKIGNQYDLSGKTISRYLRIDALIDELKLRLDNGELPFMAGVDLSFLKEDEQEMVETILDDYAFKIDLKKSEVLKTLSQGRNFNYDKAHEILSGKFFHKPKKNKKPKFTSKFTKNIVGKYVTENRSISEIEKLIEQLLEEYFLQNQEIQNEQEFEME